MRLPDRAITALAAAILVISCGPSRAPSVPGETGGTIYPVKDERVGQSQPSSPAPAYPWTSSAPPPNPETVDGAQGKNVFAARVDEEGLIHLGDSIVTEDQFLLAAKEALGESEDLVAVLFVESGIIQGIHLSAELSKLGYRNVQIFYPTATNR
jgi:hypothetical protein